MEGHEPLRVLKGLGGRRTIFSFWQTSREKLRFPVSWVAGFYGLLCLRLAPGPMAGMGGIEFWWKAVAFDCLLLSQIGFILTELC